MLIYVVLFVHTLFAANLINNGAHHGALEPRQHSTASRNGFGISSIPSASIAPKVEELLRGGRNQQLGAAALEPPLSGYGSRGSKRFHI